MTQIKGLIFLSKSKAPKNKTTKGVRIEILEFLGYLPVCTFLNNDFGMQLVTLFDIC